MELYIVYKNIKTKKKQRIYLGKNGMNVKEKKLIVVFIERN